MRTPRLWSEIKDYPVIDGWHAHEDGFRANIGDRAKIGNWANIGDRAKIGDGANIGDGAEIGNRAKIGDWAEIGDGAKIGNRAKIGNGAWIGNRAKIGNWAKIGNGAWIGNRAKIGDRANIGSVFPYYWLMGKWPLHPHSIGKVTLGCYVGDYDTLRNRTQSEWDKHKYTADHVAVILATLDHFQAIEHLVFVAATEDAK